ncbi:endonuclease/exonuclease/phosphatase family protein [Micropruina sonneratiae]|uniref:endonuclease/exonuclease/phosphatase family protein n=1 Tax=Micropruina sonneratiae TaxID=2986940 RepID=UPI0022266919|nr:endonuclease/exonuclease/phosphatase family protein [Micropruina sp. KQZ13P-5]MCW3159209.1 endonuclease/exonuclease/phosphatase family protein [Micropruina sp. KQZ13P-5]
MTPLSTRAAGSSAASARRVRPIRGQAWLVTPGLLAALPATAATYLRVVPPTTELGAKMAAFIPYGLVFWLPACVLLGIATIRACRHASRGRGVLAALSALVVAGLAATVVWEGPAFVADGPPARTAPLRILSINVASRADTDAVAQVAERADVVVFVEAGSEWAGTLIDGFHKRFPHQVPRPGEPGLGGSMIFSRYPIESAQPLPASSFQQWSAVIDTPQLGRLRVVGVHPCNPFCGVDLWRQEAEQLRGWLDGRDRSIPTVVAGDFNAVDDHLPMRELYEDGFRSAADLAGAGFVRTWPAGRRVPPLIGIDHILLDDTLTATAFTTTAVPGTDHLGVLGTIAGVG